MILAEKQQISGEFYSTITITQARPRHRQGLKPFLIIGGLFLCLSLINLWIQVVNVKRKR